ncbi:MAG: SusD/RagB family nutrient-binding outer membrane lipoprotein [Chitinophagaceae bacterium]|nr:SusD/RagB family nutrient-binding outer membrane lipoprotein [Chitinophagaceae bacterium]
MKNYFIVTVLSVVLLGSCKKFVERGNVNINPNQPSTVTLNTLLPSVAYFTGFAQTEVAYITSMFCQQMAAYSSGPFAEDQHREVRIPLAMSTIYQNALTNARILIDSAISKGAPHYAAIGRILFVTNLQLATDTYGDVPLTEAFKAPAVLQPKYDKQEDIYNFMLAELDKAIAEIAQSNPATLRPGVDDLVYGGNMTRWREAAHFMKARLYMHLTKKGIASATTNALAAMANGFTSNAGDYQIVYSDKNPNPWFVKVSGRISGSAVFTIAPSQRFLNALTGITYPGLFDPRVNRILAKTGTNPQYLGLQNGGGNVTGSNVDLRDTTFYARRISPLVIGSYAEQKLMEAEARFLANGGTPSSVGTTAAAYSAYKAGIEAHLTKLGLPLTYSTLPQVDVGAANLTLEHIMREKHVVLFLNPEAWTDVRRYDYNPNLFRGISLPINQNAEMNGQQIRRAMYPLDEINRNPNAQAAAKPMTEKVWWDQ